MRKTLRLLMMCGMGLAIAVGAVVFFSSLPLLSQTQVTDQGIWIRNPGFEETYTKVYTDQWIASPWKLWYTVTWPGESSITAPMAVSVTYPLHEGNLAQCLYSRESGSFYGCVYQQIGGITVGRSIEFSIWAQVTASMPITGQVRAGVDPNGGSDPTEISHERHPYLWQDHTASPGEWQKLSVHVRATAPTATVYACAHPTHTGVFSVYWDDAAFSVVPTLTAYLPVVFRGFCVSIFELYNPDLERSFGVFDDYQRSEQVNGFVAPYWEGFVNDDYGQPEFNRTDRDYRRLSGEVAQQYGHSSWGDFEAGIYQVVNCTFPGDTISFTIYGFGWIGWNAESAENDRVSDYTEPGGLSMRIGIDPYGGTSFTLTHIVWSTPYDPYDQWHRFEVTATAQSHQISVWALASPRRGTGTRYKQIFWDSASLTPIDSP